MSPLQLTTPRRVGLALNTYEFDQQVFLGVLRFARPFRDWTLHRDWPTVEGIEHLTAAGADGLIGQLADPNITKVVLKSGLPAVNISGWNTAPDLTCVRSDDQMVGHLAADHLYRLSCRHYAYVGHTDSDWNNQRQRGFQQGLAELRCAQAFSEWPRLDTAYLYTLQHGQRSQLGAWLRALPKPVGIFCANDIIAFCVHAVCRDSNFDLLHDVHLLGVDNDPGYSQAVYPPFSSVELGAIGSRAAECLEMLMNGQKVPPVVLVPPRRIVARDDQITGPLLPPEVHAAIAYIASHIGERIDVPDVLRHIPLSRRAFELRFKHATGRTIHEEIQNQRVDRAKMLLTATQWMLEKIAIDAGFSNPFQFSRVFRQQTGQTPTEYRRRTQFTPAP